METEQGLSVRVLFAGACRGNFNKLLKRVEKVHSKNGPFDALFCVGSFFSDTEGAQESVDNEFMQFLESGQRMPMKTYLLGAYGIPESPMGHGADSCVGHGSEAAKEKMNEVDCNIHCLGKRGVLEMPNGLTVVFLEGTYEPESFEQGTSKEHTYSSEDVESLKKSVQSHGGDVDFFLSCEWPEGITRNLPNGSVEGTANSTVGGASGVFAGMSEFPQGSPHIASLLSVIRPRYHVTSQPPLCFTRVPYKNPDLGTGSHVTRFTSLCPFGNMTKQNLFALCLTPAQFMTQDKLCEIPSDATECPFSMGEGKRAANPQVWSEAVGDDSSCTPHPYGAIYPTQPLMQNVWTQPNPALQQTQEQQSLFGVQSPQQPGSVGNGALGAGVQTLLHNIGRANVFSGMAPVDSGSLQSQGSFGSDSFGFNNAYSVHTLSSVNASPLAQPNLCGMPAVGNLQPHQMSVEMANQSPFTPVNNPSLGGDLQSVWINLAQNPQLLNAALSMGLLQAPMPMSPVAQQPMDQVYLANALANLSGSQPGLPQNLQPIAKMEMDPETLSESVLSDGQTPIPIEPERTQFPAPQSKRYKRGGVDRASFVKDRRKTCFVAHIHPDATREDVAQFFSQAGEVVHVVLNQPDKRGTAWAFVQYATQAEREHAVQTLDTAFFWDHKLVVKAAKSELEFDPNEPVKECWFCLGSPASDQALIVSVGNESYLAIDKGPISEDHVLIVPTSHYPNTLRMSDSCFEEMQSYLRGLRELFASQGRYLLAFERYLQIPRLHGNHTHISVISLDELAAKNAKETFLRRGSAQHGEWSALSAEEGNRDAIHDLVGDEEYLLVILPDGSLLIRPMLRKNRLPVSFGRDVMAELVGIPERADWKLCLSSEAEEKLRVEKFKTEFRAYDFPNQG